MKFNFQKNKKKYSTISVLLLLVLNVALFSPMNVTSSNTDENKAEPSVLDDTAASNENNKRATNSKVTKTVDSTDTTSQSSSSSVAAPPVTSLDNGTWKYGGAIQQGQSIYYVLEDVSFNSANYVIQGFETDPGAMNIIVRVKFGSLPTNADYDYYSETTDQYETIEVEVPRDDEYGDMYISIYGASGSGSHWVYAHSIYDGNGCWRSADYTATPKNGVIEDLAGTLDPMDRNDFYTLFVKSGQMVHIWGSVTLTSGSASGYVDMYLYDENLNLLAADYSGTNLEINYHVTDFESRYFYIRLENMDVDFGTKYDYDLDYTDDSTDTNKDHEGSIEVVTGSSFIGWMDSQDVNDYFNFSVNSGEKVTINFTTTTDLSSPYYDVFLYTDNLAPINDEYVKHDGVGSNHFITYYCSDYYSSEIESGTMNTLYLRVYNAALHYGVPDVAANYEVLITREYIESDDYLSGAPDYTIYGNSTTPKSGNLTGYDINDFFQITTTVGYTIQISVNTSNTVPFPYIDGYLYDNTGAKIKYDTNYNISISYTAQYTGDYYFRLYEYAASELHDSYSGEAEYSWYIYTSAIDGNDDFENADQIQPPETIESGLSSSDYADYYSVEVPSGYTLTISGTSAPATLDLFLFNTTGHKVGQDADQSSPLSISYMHTGIDTETYFVCVNNTFGHSAINYNLYINLLNSDPDGDGTLEQATVLPLYTNGNVTETDSLSGTDINDFYTFNAIAGDRLFFNISGLPGMKIRLFDNEYSGPDDYVLERTLESSQLTFEYFPNSYYPASPYYVQIGNPDGDFSGSYDLFITREEYDIVDGYYLVSNSINSSLDHTYTGDLSYNDTNDWHSFYLMSGEYVDVTFESIGVNAPHFGLKMFYGFDSIIYDDGASFNFNITNLDISSQLVYFQVVNEAQSEGQYSISLDFTSIDTDNNGLTSNADEITYDTNIDSTLAFDDINDYYKVEIRSGYNFTVQYNTNATDPGFYCILVSIYGHFIESTSGNFGTINFFNMNRDPIEAYVQFFNYRPYLGYNASSSVFGFTWNASLVQTDPDGDFHKANTITDLSTIISDSLYADPGTNNYSDLNDFYSIELEKGGVLSLSVSITGTNFPHFGVYIYNEDQEMVALHQANDTYDITFVAGANDGTYYIRVYDAYLHDGDYTIALSSYIDDDSYHDGSTPLPGGDSSTDNMSSSDIVDIYNTELKPGWRMKVNATVSGSSPDVNLYIFDPDKLATDYSDVNGTTYLETEFTAQKQGKYYIQFSNTGGTSVDYTVYVYVYEDENGIFDNATAIKNGDYSDDVQELDKFDYYVLTGVANQLFTVSASVDTLNLELYLYDANQIFIDSDISGPGLSVAHQPSEGALFYILFQNPTGQTGNYSFTVTGAGKLPDVGGPEADDPFGDIIDLLMESSIAGIPNWVYPVVGMVGLILLIRWRRRKGKQKKP